MHKYFQFLFFFKRIISQLFASIRFILKMSLNWIFVTTGPDLKLAEKPLEIDFLGGVSGGRYGKSSSSSNIY